MPRMNSDLTMMRLIRGQRAEVFNYFINPGLLESWAYPDGMSLRVPVFNPKNGGSYRMEHTNADGGIYVCTGHIKDFGPGSKLIQVDNVVDPDGKVVLSKIETVTTFNDKPGGTFITIIQKGFTDEKSMRECEAGWNQCLDRLDSMFSGQITATV